MSASNCPETPRQRMIGMMYLFLTAMLAINVSPQVLEGFILVDRGLQKSNENFEIRNNDIYAAFKSQEDINPSKVKAWREKAISVKVEADSMTTFIQKWKNKMAIVSDGPLGNPDSLITKDNYDIPGQVMLPAEKPRAKWPGIHLREKVEAYRENLIKSIDPKEKALINAINSNLDTSSPKGTGEGAKTWEQNIFSEVPIAAVMALMSKLQNDVRNTEAMVIQYLFRQITAKDFKVNEVEAYIIPTSTYIVKGGKIEAKILLAASDTTKQPVITVNNKVLENNEGVFEQICNETGKFELKAKIALVNDEGESNDYEKSIEYQVVEPFATISATKMNVLYAGIENPISISVPGIPSDQIEARLGGINLPASKDGKGYVAKPMKVGKTLITVFANINGEIQQIGTGMEFKVKPLPPPVGYIIYYSNVKNAQGKIEKVLTKFGGGKINKGDLLDSPGLIAELQESDFQIDYKLTSFEITTFDSMGNAKKIKSDGDKFSQEQKSAIKGLARKASFYIGAVKAMGPDGLPKDLNAIEVIVN